MTSAISEGEKKYIIEGVRQDVRSDGRRRLDYRYISIESGLLSQTNGSARVSLLGGRTEILAGVKCELIDPSSDHPNEGKVIVTVDHWSGATSSSTSSSPATLIDMNTVYTNLLNKHLNAPGVIDLTKLCVIPKKHVWCIYVDIIILNHSAGAVLDMCTLVTYTALKDTKLPKLRLIKTETEGEFDIELDDDPYAFTPFPYDRIPLTVTLHQLGDYCIVDADGNEEICSTARITVAINQQGNICTVSSNGTTGIKPSSLHAAIEAGRTLAPLLYGRIENALRKQPSPISSSSSSSLSNLTPSSSTSAIGLNTLHTNGLDLHEGIVTADLLHHPSATNLPNVNIIGTQNMVHLPSVKKSSHG